MGFDHCHTPPDIYNVPGLIHCLKLWRARAAVPATVLELVDELVEDLQDEYEGDMYDDGQGLHGVLEEDG